jgi:hypothetical protein
MVLDRNTDARQLQPVNKYVTSKLHWRRISSVMSASNILTLTWM